MLFNRISEFHSTLAFRLTLWYGAVFTVLTSAAFLFFYLMITSSMNQRTDKDLLNQLGEFAAIYNLEGLETLERTAMMESQAAGEEKVFFRLLYPSGLAFSSSNMSYWKDIGVDRKAVNRLVKGQDHVFETVTVGDLKNSVRVIYAIIGKGIVVQLGRSMENDIRILGTFQKLFFTTMTILIITAAVVGWFMAKRALSGVEAVTMTARQISETDLGKRVPVKSNNDEIDQLAVTFNQMLDRIEKLISGIREMSDNIAHDLKSPVTRIRGHAEVTITGKNRMEDYEAMAMGTIEECDMLIDMINTMLFISKTEAGADAIAHDVLDMAQLVQKACELFQPLAEDKNISFQWDLPEPCMIKGDQHLLQRMTANLLDNAFKYTPVSGKVDISVSNDKKNKGDIKIRIEDTGTGISPEDLDLIFNRFYRCDQSRSQSGAGLGLSLARAVATAHGGDIKVRSMPGAGSVFTVSIPA